jgi:hypothetical protein
LILFSHSLFTSLAQTVTLNLPGLLYQKVQRMAQTLRRPIEDILVDAVATALPPLAGLPPELADDLDELAFLNDEALWQVARSTLPAGHHQQMDDLLTQKGSAPLTAAEQQTLDRLLGEYQSLVLRRGQAAVLLQRRGYDMSNPSVLSRRDKMKIAQKCISGKESSNFKS